MLFECDARAGALRVSLIGREAKYSGTIHIDAAVGEAGLRETCVLRCVPQAGRVQRVLVQFFPRRRSAPRWSMGGDEVSARKWSDHEQTKAGWDASLETWELTLRHPKSTPFEITALREVSAAEATSASAGGGPFVLTLASLPEATSQAGSLAVRRAGPRVIRIDTRRLKPVPPESPALGRAQAVQGAFRYSPASQVAQGAAAALRVSVLEKPDAWQAWVWNSHLESWYQADGATRHQATLDLQNATRRRLGLVLPPGVARGRAASCDRRRPRRLAMEGNRRGRPSDGGFAGGPNVSPRGNRMDRFGATAGNRRFVGPAAAGTGRARAGPLVDGLVAARL